MAKEFSICPTCGAVIGNPDMHADYHTWVDSVIQGVLDFVQVPEDKRPPKPEKKDH